MITQRKSTKVTLRVGRKFSLCVDRVGKCFESNQRAWLNQSKTISDGRLPTSTCFSAKYRTIEIINYMVTSTLIYFRKF